MTDFLKSVIKDVGNEYASLVIDGVEAVSYTHLTLPTIYSV